MKYSHFTSSSIILALAIIPIVTHAAPVKPTPRASLATTPSPSISAQTAVMTKLKSEGDREINRRIAALNVVKGRLSAIKKLSQSTVATLTNEVDQEVSSLTNLKTKLDADSDLSTVRTDVQSIVQSYRVYALYIPQIHVFASADMIEQIDDQFTTLAASLKTDLASARASGIDTTADQAALTDLQAKVADAARQSQTAIADVTPLQPSGFPGNKPTIETANKALRTARQDLAAARHDAATIISSLKPPASPSPTITTPM